MSTRVIREKVEIDSGKVREFFENRRGKDLPHRYNYVNYQDGNPALAIERDGEEKAKVGKYLHFRGTDKVLDVGCGVGRWGDLVVPLLTTGRYVGVDYVEYFLDLAREHFQDNTVTRFCRGEFRDITEVLKENGVYEEYNVILLNGILMYINEGELTTCLRQADDLLRDGGLLYIKESVGMEERLTLKEFYSEELNAEYNVIYRSLKEYTAIISEYFLRREYTLLTCQATWDAVVDYDKETSNWFWILKK